MTIDERGARTFDALRDADLEQVYLQGKEEMLRDRAFRILLAHADSVPKLERLAFEGERGLVAWTTEELLELSNRFRLLSSPENEIRIYQQCHDEVFRNTARVREFYILALNRVGRVAEAIDAALDIIARGNHNALVWGMLGESYSARMIFAEQLAEALRQVEKGNGKDNDPEAQQRLLNLQSKLLHFFPEQAVVHTSPLSAIDLESLQQKNLEAAERIFRQGFRESGMSFPGLGWMLRTIDRMVGWVMTFEKTRSRILSRDGHTHESLAHMGSALFAKLNASMRRLSAQAELVAVALELQGGDESLDYWTHAGQVQLAVMRGDPLSTLEAHIAHALATADAAFKFAITLKELTRIRDQFARIRDALNQPQRDSLRLDARLTNAEYALATFAQMQAQFSGQRVNGSAIQQTNESTLDWMLRKTINFRALTGNLVPLYIEGSIGRIGARVPDLMINRRVREDLIDLLEDRVLRALSAEDRENPHAVIARIHQVVGQGLRLDELQDLQSPAHAAFDARSDGLIALSGVDREMRKDTRTSTDLTAALLMQTGDCRETMFLNGALFACWQQMQASKKIATAILCLEFDHQAGFDRLVNEELPALLRYQLRGGQTAVFVDSIAMADKYQCRQTPNGIACLRRYGLDEWRAGVPMTRYELENSRIEATDRDGHVRWIDPIDPSTGRWQPIEHQPLGEHGEGVPIIPDADNLKSLRLLHLVEEHAMTFLYDAQAQTMMACDGFYNERLFASPYPFANHAIALGPHQAKQWIHVAERLLEDERGVQVPSSVYLRFLPFSHTDYAVGLVEGDIPGRLQLMGRTFNADFRLERRRIEEGLSAIPDVLAKVQRWYVERSVAPQSDRATLDRQLARLILELAKDDPDLVEFKEVEIYQALICENCQNDHVYLVLSGQLQIYRDGQPLLEPSGVARGVAAGEVVGEISALSGGLASATVCGNAVVLGISMSVIQQQLDTHPALRTSMEALARSRVP